MSPPREPAEAALVRALQRGEAEAVGELYARHGADVLRWVIRLGGPRLDAEDVAHEVFVVALRTGRRFRGDSSLRTWLFGVTRGVVANARRKAALRRFVGLDRVAEPRAPFGGEEVQRRLEARRRVQWALEGLSQGQREVVVLCDLEGFSAPEAAALLGIAAGTVYSRLHGARRALRASLEAEGVELDATPGATVVSLRRERREREGPA